MELQNKIYCGDSLELIKQIPDKSIDLVYTDPPYLLPYSISHTIKNSIDWTNLKKTTLKIRRMEKQLVEANITEFNITEFLELSIRIQKKINMYIWCSKYQLIDIFKFIEKYNLIYYILVWCKTNPLPSYSNNYNNDKEICLLIKEKKVYLQPKDFRSGFSYFVQPLNQKDKSKYKHPTIKPLNIVKTMIENSTHEGDLVFDPFLGSGTTAVACYKLNRKYLGIEKNKDFFDVAVKRIEETKKIKELL